MSVCDAYEPLIERLLADEIAAGDRDRLLGHAETCEDCRQFVDLHFRLLDPPLDPELPDEAEFTTMRQGVMRRIRALDRPAGERIGILGFLRGLTVRPAYATALAAALVVTLGLGIFIGGEMGDRVITLNEPPIGRDPLLVQIREEARQNRVLSDVENSPYIYSNASFRPNNDGTLTMSFDVTRHMQVRRPRQDPLVNEVLAQTMLSPATVGARLDALSIAATQRDEKIKQALIFSMLNDPSLPVRLRALNALSRFEPDDDTESAFVAVLRGEEAVQMRLLALDWLAESEPGAQRVDDVLRDLAPAQDSPLWIRAARYDRGAAAPGTEAEGTQP